MIERISRCKPLLRAVGPGFLIALLCTGTAWADEFKSRLITLKYSSPDQLETFVKKTRPNAVTRTLNNVFLGKGDPSDLAAFLDGLFQRVQMVLDMPMPKLMINIQIHRNQREVSDASLETTGKPTSAPAFYSSATNTIHLQTEKLFIGMLAHEMGHSIIDHYFVVKPPPKISEILCQYVDKEISSGDQ